MFLTDDRVATDVQVDFEGIENAMYVDELVLCKAQLRNNGPVPLKGLRLTVQQSDLHCCRSDFHLTAEHSSPAGEQSGQKVEFAASMSLFYSSATCDFS